MGELANEAIRRLRQEREATLQALLPLEDEDCRASAHLYGAQRSVNFVLRAFSSHALDHLQHAQRLLAARGVRQREAQLLLMKAQALLAELEVMLLGLSDEDFAAIGPNEGDWSAQQIVDHFIEDRTSLSRGSNLGCGAAALRGSYWRIAAPAEE